MEIALKFYNNRKEEKAMIKFNSNEDNKQFISISIEDGSNPEEVLTAISVNHPAIVANLYKMDNSEILLKLDKCGLYGFSLNALRSLVAKVANADVYVFCVDLDELTQRYRG